MRRGNLRIHRAQQTSGLIAVQEPTADRISGYIVAGGDGDGLVKLLLEIKGKAEQRLGRRLEVISCDEAGFDGFWLHRLLAANGIDSHVVDPASIQVNRRPRRAKTGRLDMARLPRALLAICRGEPQLCIMVRVGACLRTPTAKVTHGRLTPVVTANSAWVRLFVSTNMVRGLGAPT